MNEGLQRPANPATPTPTRPWPPPHLLKGPKACLPQSPGPSWGFQSHLAPLGAEQSPARPGSWQRSGGPGRDMPARGHWT